MPAKEAKISNEVIMLPPIWYLYCVILNSLIFLFRHFFIDVDPTGIISIVSIALALTWLCVNIGMIWYLRKHRAEKQAYLFPVYFIGIALLQTVGLIFFVPIWNLRYSDIEYFLGNNFESAFVLATTGFEVLTAILQLRNKPTNGISTPPIGYLGIVILNKALSLYFNDLQYSPFYLDFWKMCWFGISASVIYLLYTSQAKKQAYVLPIYYLLKPIAYFGSILAFGPAIAFVLAQIWYSLIGLEIIFASYQIWVWKHAQR